MGNCCKDTKVTLTSLYSVLSFQRCVMALNLLNDSSIKNAKPKEGPYKMRDGGGLFLLVSPEGAKWWRFRYRFAGKEKSMSLGVYPAVSLKMARELRDDAKNKLVAGINPVKFRQRLQQEAVTNANSFETIAREWYDRQLSNLAESTKSRIKIRLENDVFPALGEMNISEITAPDILNVLRRVESREALETAKRILQYCGRIFRYAIATGRAQRDISTDLKDALPPSKVKHFPSLTKPKDIANLIKSIDNFHGNFIVRSALQISALVFLRPVELRLGQWNEIDFDKGEWHIPENRMKMKEKHIVPLYRHPRLLLCLVLPESQVPG